MLPVHVVNDAPEMVHRLVKEIANTYRSPSGKVEVFVVDDVTVVVKTDVNNQLCMHVYVFNETCYPAAQLRDDDKKRVVLYEIDRADPPYCIKVEVVLEALRGVRDVIQRRLPATGV